MKNLYWKQISEIYFKEAFEKNKTPSEFIPVYRGRCKVWQGKTGWFSRVPLYLVMESGENAVVGIHYINGKNFLSARSNRDSRERKIILDSLDSCLNDIQIGKNEFFESLEKMKKEYNFQGKEQNDLDKLVCLLDPTKKQPEVVKEEVNNKKHSGMRE